ncbi:hypothetical protein [Prevotella fusca]|uniref:YubB ferredoxin-like domain-containing protein n=1 Tax=Prevotella fusca JCM 17724 TaxID=1236517 RepID=A0A0K1NMI7_9BACT|nr:hypothetical protein [Prevotella fusca]AKU70302.1 hypothetical protein ADJ77_11015 [Prevotella fusca JCM 17724]QUB85925.1 hypothetical protein J5A51_01270 [Prevotella fusca JCM 17724]
MANWASTSYRIEGSESDLKKVYDVIDNFVTGKSKPVLEDASKEWEGNIVKALGASDEQLKESYLRGFIEEYELDGDVIRINAEEAWGATDFRHILGDLMPELTIYYIVEEAGCDVFATNDIDGKYFPEQYLVDAYVKDADYYEYFETEKQMRDFVSTMIDKEDFTDEDIEAWNEEHEDDDSYIYVHEFQYVE